MSKRSLSRALVVGLLLAGGALPAFAEADDRLRAAKELFYDKKYEEARRAWQLVLAGATGPDAEAAAYGIARCSENLGELERAFQEYGQYLGRSPSDRAVAEEARTSRVGLAARLYKRGMKQHLDVLTAGLSDPAKSVRYYAALQVCGLGPEVGQAAVPVLKRIVAGEADEDLVERAKLCLLRLQPQALSPAPGKAPPATGKTATWVRVRIYGKGKSTPEVSVNLPLALADLVFKSLPEETRRDLRQKGYDADNFWERLKKLGPTEIIDIRGEEGEKVQIWIE